MMWYSMEKSNATSTLLRTRADVNIKVQVYSGMISYVFDPKTVPEDYNARVYFRWQILEVLNL
jgi:hypothetical protein